MKGSFFLIAFLMRGVATSKQVNPSLRDKASPSICASRGEQLFRMNWRARATREGGEHREELRALVIELCDGQVGTVESTVHT